MIAPTSPDNLPAAANPSAAAGPDERAPASDPDIAQNPDAQPFPVVGVGSSAGGLNALSEFLKELPDETGMAYVLIQHLSPTYPSQLVALLKPTTRHAIVQAQDGLAVLVDCVYVIAPNTSLTIVSGVLRVAPRDGSTQPHYSIDEFLRSLAKDRPGRAIGVVLSGTGTDGAMGLAAIKAAGGITYAHDDSAEHGAMPLNAIAHGCVDFILSAGEIARAMGKIHCHGFPAPSGYAEANHDINQDAVADPPADARDPAAYARIIAALGSASGTDFTHYRPTTISRRIARRMLMHSLTSLGSYADHLEAHVEEAAALLKDILIGVTSFYRDRAAFQAVASTIFPQLLEHREAAGPIRIWVIGCATGQEPYTLAIELLEHLKDAARQPAIQVFATDISDWSLAKARAGWFPESIAVDVPPDRLQRYFTKAGAGYRIAKAVRDLCVFAKHDITSEIPFGRMDLISCRNVLIYLGPQLQRKVLPTIHFALKPGGFLMLGSSETVGRFAHLFETVDERHCIFRRISAPAHSSPPPARIRQVPARMPRPPALPPPTDSDMQRAADRIVLGRFSPPGVLVNAALDVIQYRGRTAPFLEPAAGDASLNLLTMVPFAVGEALRRAIVEATERNIPVRCPRVAHRRENAFRDIAFEVVPVRIPPNPADTFLILFEELPGTGPGAASASPLARPGPSDRAPSAEPNELTQLRYELAAATDYIHALIEQNGAQADQLKVAQEEASSTSEEFQSTNEELQTTKEEIESTNEELTTLNEELRRANSDLGAAAGELAEQGRLTGAIVETMRYPLLVLDGDLRVVLANQAFLTDFKVSLAETRGRLVYQLGNGQWNIPALRRLLEDVLPSNSAFDDFEVTHEFADIGWRSMLLNARRLESGAAQSHRVVLVIADITERSLLAKRLKDTAAELLRSNAELDQFAAVASHDLQEPLRMISGYASLMQRNYSQAIDERGRECLSQVSGAAKRMMDMIVAILAFSRLGQHDVLVESIDSAKALRSALANLKRTIETKSATIEVDDLPKVNANAEQLAQLFQNLIGNALKFSSPDRPLVIRVSAVTTETETTFAIADNGIGIAEGDHPRIFQLFTRLNAMSEYAGAGIGLATCKKIVEHHGGRIRVESKLGEGTTFFCSFPT
ncbi:MAG: PAS domain-containing protein [Planctomycetes bacterium]|nr:PAS domain-containing protein [Planctomycetota bacterium]